MTTARPATLIDVAVLAGVSKSTASNAITGSGRLSAATRDAVLAAATQLGYVPNRAARRLRSGATGTIGVYIPETPTRSDYYTNFVFGVLERAARTDVDVTVIARASASGRDRIPNVDGVIVADPHSGDQFSDRLLTSGLAAVTCERPPAELVVDGIVSADHSAAMRALLDHLYRHGSRRPGLLIPSEQGDWAARSSAGYREWCADHDLAPLVEHIDWVPTTSHLHQRLGLLEARDPAMDALICGPVDSAAMMLPGLRASGRRIGDDFLLACGTDSTVLGFTDPPITAIDLLPREAGERCADLLLAVMAGAVERGTEIELPIALVERRSTMGRVGGSPEGARPS